MIKVCIGDGVRVLGGLVAMLHLHISCTLNLLKGMDCPHASSGGSVYCSNHHLAATTIIAQLEPISTRVKLAAAL